MYIITPMNNRDLHTLCRIASIGSFVRAADELNLPLSTVSMQMKTLEKQLGLSLFDRTIRPPALTPMGRQIAQKAQDILGAESQLLAVATDKDDLSGIWRLGLVATASVRLLPGFLKRASKQARKAHFEVETGLSEVLETKVAAGQLDAAVVTASEYSGSELQYYLLRQEPLVFAIPKPHSALKENELAKALTFLQFNPGTGIGKLIKSYTGTQSSVPERSIVLDSVEAIMECVNAGLGYTLLTEADATRYASPSTIIVSPKAEMLNRNLVLAWSKRATLGSKMANLAKLF